jgi:hypothetical protein
MRVSEDIDGLVITGPEHGLLHLPFPAGRRTIPPHWPGPAHPSAAASDIRVNDADCVEHELPSPGATRVRASIRRASGYSQTPPVTRSAPSSVITAQAEPIARAASAAQGTPGGTIQPPGSRRQTLLKSRSWHAELPGEADPTHARADGPEACRSPRRHAERRTIPGTTRAERP